MTVYSPYQDSGDYVWYVDVMTPNGVKKQEIMNPLYYFQMMNVKPPVGSEFSEDTVEDYQSMCAEAESMNDSLDYSILEPYNNLEVLPLTYDTMAPKINLPSTLPAVYISINAKSNPSSSSSLIPLTTPFVSIKSNLNLSKTKKKVNTVNEPLFSPVSTKVLNLKAAKPCDAFDSKDNGFNKSFDTWHEDKCKTPIKGFKESKAIKNSVFLTDEKWWAVFNKLPISEI